jgi:DNA mismatch endonuclease (patch repair protein)
MKRLPKKYWQGKIKKNVMRDKKNRAILRKEGWAVLRVWENSIYKNYIKEADKIQRFLLNGL